MRVPLLFTLAMAALAAALASCGSDEEVAPNVTPAATTAATATPATTSPSPAPIPADWPTYTDPGGKISLRYPPTWFAEDYSLYSVDPRTFDPLDPRAPPEIVEVEFHYYEAKGSSGCGDLTVDPSTGEGTPQEGAIRTTLGGVEAWEVVRGAGDPAIEGNLTRIQGVAAIHNGYCFILAAYFTQAEPDVKTFLQIASGYRFLDVSTGASSTRSGARTSSGRCPLHTSTSASAASRRGSTTTARASR